ncbi:hypothetical protein [uncultured Roseobacter sp.]|uniref:hypothetical protein n=1 Tax=uncultured Roseobacter sp. TaxID=114847 RepID=UPI0026102274|nr:hypothetical protein [uncultured Roseobacter sp.]
MTAFLMRQRDLPDFKEWVTGTRDRAAFVQKWTAQWDKIDAALAASRKHRCSNR